MKTAPRRVLVIGLRRLGDLLLATALIRSLRRAWPQACIDVLVPQGCEPVFAGNPDVSRTIAFTRGQGGLSLALRLLRRYDLSVSLQMEDRAQFLALLAAPLRASIVPIIGNPGWRWKRWINRVAVQEDLHQTHVVVQYLRLAEGFGLSTVRVLVAPQPSLPAAVRAARAARGLQGAYAVVHPQPLYPYKAWTDEGWGTVIRGLRSRGLAVAVTGGPGEAEGRQVARLLEPHGSDPGVVNLCGALGLPDLAALLVDARLYVGPDTSITHLAAAAGTATLALFGPSNPIAWGPWPAGFSGPGTSPWEEVGALQRHGRVWLLQGTQGRFPACIPCMQEGCERRRDSTSDCLVHLEPSRVLAAIDGLLGEPPREATPAA